MKAEVEYHITRADREDVKYWTSARAGKDRVEKMEVGDELVRVPLSIGPVGVDHDHWAGHHLTCSIAQAERIAWLISNDPDFPEE